MAEPSLAPDSPLALDILASPVAQGKKLQLRFRLADDVALLTQVAARDRPFKFNSNVWSGVLEIHD